MSEWLKEYAGWYLNKLLSIILWGRPRTPGRLQADKGFFFIKTRQDSSRLN